MIEIYKDLGLYQEALVNVVRKGREGADPASVVYDTLSKAEATKADVVIIDTAGRLHNKANLMRELEKINKIISMFYFW